MAVDVSVLRSSFEKVKPIAGEAIAYFYSYMFEKYPDAKKLFEGVDMAKQHKALIGALVWVVDNLENEKALVTNLKKMGARHVAYGVKEEHYPIVGECLLATFAHFFKEAWTRKLEANWAEAYEFIAGTMVDGAREATPRREATSDLSSTASEMARKILINAFDELLKSDEFQKELRARAARMLQQAVEEEAERALSIRRAA